MINKTILQKIIDSCNQDDVADFLEKQIQVINLTQTKIVDVEMLEEEYRIELKEKLASLKETTKNIQDQCPHWAVDYNPDPSGNNDSYYSCNHCGKQSKKYIEPNLK